MDLTIDQIEAVVRRVVREEIDATAGLQEDAFDPEDVPWMFVNADGVYNVKALYSDNQLRMLEAGRNVSISPHVFTIFHRSAAAVRDGKRGIAEGAAGDRLRNFIADNPDHYG